MTLTVSLILDDFDEQLYPFWTNDKKIEIYFRQTSIFACGPLAQFRIGRVERVFKFHKTGSRAAKRFIKEFCDASTNYLYALAAASKTLLSSRTL